MYTVCHKVGHEPTGRKLSDFIALCGSLVEKETYLDNMYVVLYRLIHILRKSYCFLTLCVCVLIFFFFKTLAVKSFRILLLVSLRSHMSPVSLRQQCNFLPQPSSQQSNGKVSSPTTTLSTLPL